MKTVVAIDQQNIWDTTNSSGKKKWRKEKGALAQGRNFMVCRLKGDKRGAEEAIRICDE